MPETNTPLDTSTPRRDGADVVAFTAINPLGVQNWYFEAISLRPIHSRAYASAPALPLTPQDSLPTRWLDSGRTGLSPAGRLFRISWLSHFAFPFGPAFPGRTDGHRARREGVPAFGGAGEMKPERVTSFTARALVEQLAQPAPAHAVGCGPREPNLASDGFDVGNGYGPEAA